MNGAIADSVRRCTACPLHARHHGPVPFEGARGAEFLFLGAAPSAAEDATRRQFKGKAGSYLRSVVRRLGIPDSQSAYGHVVSCRVAGRTGKDIAPKPVDVGSCRTIRTLQVAAVDPKVVVLLGATAMKAWRPDWEHKRMVGWPFTSDGRLFVVAPHPADALKDEDADRKLHMAIRWARARARQGRLLDLIDWPDTCSVCHAEDVDIYDTMGVPYGRRCSDLMGKERIYGDQLRLV